MQTSFLTRKTALWFLNVRATTKRSVRFQSALILQLFERLLERRKFRVVAGAKNNDSFIRVCDVFDYHLDIYAVYFIFPPIFICMQLMCAQCCTPQKATSIKYHAPCLHILHITYSFH